MKALLKEELYKVEIKENNEPLVEILETERVKLLREHRYLSPYLRGAVVDMLHVAADNLPADHKLLVVTAYRPKWMQQELWEQRVWQMTKRHPFKRLFSPKKFKRMVGVYTAPPGGSSHQCGAAVDVTILDPEGNRFDMGAELTDFGKKCHTETDLITEKQKQNRRALFDAMTKAGFVNYPLEWWHYSYGDRHWAAQTNRGECQYGFIEE